MDTSEGNDQEDEDDDPFTLNLDDVERWERNYIWSIMADVGPEWLDQSDKESIAASFALARSRIQLEKELVEVDRRITDIVESSEDDISDQAHLEVVLSTRNKVVEFFTLCSALIEQSSIRILEKELITEEYSGARKTNHLLERRMDQKTREDLLLRTGLIDQDLKSEMVHVRSLRNDLVHGFVDRMLLDEVDDISSEADRAYSVHMGLSRLSSNEDAYTLSFDVIEEFT